MRRPAAAVVIGAALALTTWARPAAAQAPDGQALFQANCRKCHGTTGTPTARMAEMYPEMKPFSQLTGVSADSVIHVMTTGAGKEMKPFKDKLTADEMKAVAQYVLTLTKPKTP